MFRWWFSSGLFVLGLSAQTDSPTVVVVGAGIAGLTTALEASRGGATVAVVDVASVFGGHAVVSEGGLALVDTPLQARLGAKDSADLAYQDFVRWGDDVNQPWVRMYVDRSKRDIYDWMTDLGVQFNGLGMPPGNSVARFHMNPRRGYGLVEPIYRECLKSGKVTFHWNIRITSLIQEKDERVAGVRGVNERTGAAFQLRGKSVVIATGGFQSNLALVRRNWPPDMPFPATVLVGSGVNAHGSGLDLARAAGGTVERLDHQWNYPRGVPDPRYPGMDRGLHIVNYAAIWVNKNGERFVNESAASSVVLKEMLRQPEGRAWVVFDAIGRKTMTISGTDWADPKRVDRLILGNSNLVTQADTLEQLAQQAGWPVQRFLNTVAGFNKSLESGTDISFNRFNPGNPPTARLGRAAIARVEVPPFYAVAVYPMTRKSLGGVVADLECRVLNSRHEPIPNLYAAGEVTGFNGLNGKAGLEGTFLGPSILQGRILGQNLAKLASVSPTSAPVEKVDRKTAGSVEAACQSCHPLQTLVSTPRKGYWHFERVHKLVLERARECRTCHAELTPFVASRHRTDPLSQTAACSSCHLGNE